MLTPAGGQLFSACPQPGRGHQGCLGRREEQGTSECGSLCLSLGQCHTAGRGCPLQKNSWWRWQCTCRRSWCGVAGLWVRMGEWKGWCGGKGSLSGDSSGDSSKARGLRVELFGARTGTRVHQASAEPPKSLCPPCGFLWCSSISLPPIHTNQPFSAPPGHKGPPGPFHSPHHPCSWLPVLHTPSHPPPHPHQPSEAPPGSKPPQGCPPPPHGSCRSPPVMLPAVLPAPSPGVAQEPPPSSSHQEATPGGHQEHLLSLASLHATR